MDDLIELGKMAAVILAIGLLIGTGMYFDGE